MDYNHVNSFLDKIKNLLNKASFNHDTIADIISEEIHQKITPEKLKIKQTTVTVQVSPMVKSEIFLHKENILKKIKENGITILDIR